MPAKHTPGPWRYAPTNNGHMIAGALPGYLAEVRDCGSGDVRANAALIAAAPDLLDALEEIVDAQKGGHLGWCHIDAAIDAIAKARGTA